MAVTIGGLLVCTVLGLVAAAITRQWLDAALGTFLGTVAGAGIGLYLAAR